MTKDIAFSTKRTLDYAAPGPAAARRAASASPAVGLIGAAATVAGGVGLVYLWECVSFRFGW